MSAISQEQHVLSLPPTDRVEHFHLSRSHSVVSWNDGIAVWFSFEFGIAVWFSFEFFCLFYFSSQEIILSIILCVRVFYWHCLRKIDTLQTCTEVDKILCSVSGNVINITWHVLFLTSDGPSSLRHCWRPLLWKRWQFIYYCFKRLPNCSVFNDRLYIVVVVGCKIGIHDFFTSNPIGLHWQSCNPSATAVAPV